MSHLGVFLDGETLTGEVGTPAGLADLLRDLNAADVIQSASKILLVLESLDTHGVRGAQDSLVDLFPAELHPRLRELMAGVPDGGGILFYPQQLLALQRLATVFGRPGNPTSFGGGSEWGQFLKACAWTGDVATAVSGFDGTTDVDRETVAIWAIRNGEANRLAFYRATAGRAFQMWFNSGAPWPQDLRSIDDYCRERYRLTYREFVALALSPAFARVNLANPNPSDAIFVPTQFLRTSRFNPSEIERVFEDLTFQPSATDPEAAEPYWSFTRFALRPYIAAPFPNLAATSVRFAFERATTATFWMLHQAHAGAVGDFTTHFGAVFQDYCLRLAASVERETCRVQDEFAYRNGLGDTVQTSDILIAEGGGCAPASIFIECAALRPRGDLLSDGSRDAFLDYFERLVGKLEQLDRVIGDYLAGAFSLPNAIGTVNDSVIPLLVVDKPFQWSFALRAMVDDRVRTEGWFRWPQVTRPVVCSISEFENLAHAVEKGDYIAEVLRAFISSGQDSPLEQFLFERGGELEVPAFVNDGFTGITELIIDELRLPKDP